MSGMTAIAARLAMALAVRSLAPRRRAWAQAMEAEFAVADADGRALGFALGCLWGAWRMLPRHADGRFALASHAVAFALLVPLAALLAAAVALGFPCVDASAGLGGFVSGQGKFVSSLNAGTRAIGAALTLTTMLVAVGHLPLAWWVLERDWARVAAAMRLGAAALVTLAIAAACAGLDGATLLPLVAAWTIDVATVATLARWHARRRADDVDGAFDTAF